MFICMDGAVHSGGEEADGAANLPAESAPTDQSRITKW